jgi:threonine/homoserine efflux transporter RhtA
MVRQSASKGGATSGAYAIANAAIWVFYAALVLLVTWVLAVSDPVTVTVTVLIAALVFRPMRRRITRAARRRFTR